MSGSPFWSRCPTATRDALKLETASPARSPMVTAASTRLFEAAGSTASWETATRLVTTTSTVPVKEMTFTVHVTAW
jgi:hypothetical protein